ncbi:MAG: hypothetical protein ACOX61_08005, partial [Brooklawnia sp.]|jgi:transcription-repair coupling factor (superfamily II helicase)
VMTQRNYIRFGPVHGRQLADGRTTDLPESRQLRLQRLYPQTLVKAAANVALVPRPRTSGVPSVPIEGTELLDWAGRLVDAVFAPVSVPAQ